MRPSESPFVTGLRDAAPFIVAVIPFALVFGVVAREAGWSLAQTVAMSVLVIAGAAQFTAVQLLQENAPVLVVIATALAVNLRLAMYSASLAMHVGGAPLAQRAAIAYLLTDQSYACAASRWALVPEMRLGQKVAYFLGAALPLVPFWYGFTWVGAVMGAALPEALALDFAVPVMFLAMIGGMLRERAQVLAASLAVVGSLVLAGLPYSLGVIVAAAAAMAVGAFFGSASESDR